MRWCASYIVVLGLAIVRSGTGLAESSGGGATASHRAEFSVDLGYAPGARLEKLTSDTNPESNFQGAILNFYGTIPKSVAGFLSGAYVSGQQLQKDFNQSSAAADDSTTTETIRTGTLGLYWGGRYGTIAGMGLMIRAGFGFSGAKIMQEGPTPKEQTYGAGWDLRLTVGIAPSGADSGLFCVAGPQVMGFFKGKDNETEEHLSNIRITELTFAVGYLFGAY